MEDDRRATIEAAFDAAEKATDANPEVTEVAVKAEVPAEATEAATDTPAAEATTAATEGEAPSATGEAKEATPTNPTESVKDDAPVSWKLPLKAKWSTIDPEVRQEVLRRERDVSRVLNESSAARQVVKQLNEVVQPYAPRFQAMGIDPVTAFKNLLQADYQLANGSKQQRAQLLAKLISDYDVDINTLDQVLAGRTSPEATDEARIDKLLQQRLAPVQQRLQTFEERERYEQQATAQAFQAQIQELETDSQQFPFFQQVRDAMADLIELNARKGVSLDLKSAYNRAVAADSSLIAQLDQVRKIEAAKLAAEKAQRAKAASASVSGSPTGNLAKSPALTDRRATIAAAFDALGS